MPSKFGSAAPQTPTTAKEAARWLCGWAGPEKAAAALREIQPDGKSFAESFYQFRITGAAPNAGAGQTVRGWELYEKATGQEPDLTPQPTGNCFLGDMMVRMADGREKPIERVVVGDMAYGPSGMPRKVTKVLARPYSGEIVSMHAGLGLRILSATPEHLIAAVAAGSDKPRWVPIADLEESQRLFPVANSIENSVRRLSTANASNVMVHCLEVEEEHAFIANDYVVHNCVAASADDIVELTQCVQILVNGGTFKPIYNPFHYATGRVLVGKNQLRGGAGSMGSWQAKALELYATTKICSP